MKNPTFHNHPGVISTMGPILLEGAVQHYEWGQKGPRALIPKLLGRPAEPGRPYAELWLGAHPAKPSLAHLAAGKRSLEDVINAAPKAILGKDSVRRFHGRLPYLMKVLDIARPLSVQAHPNERQARQGFRLEEKRGIPLSAPHRNYRDDRAKPELLIALSDFYALCRFRPWNEILRSLGTLPNFLALLLKSLSGLHSSQNPLKRLYRHLMTLRQEDVDLLLDAFIRDVSKETSRGEWKTVRPWLLAADRDFSVHRRRDRGLFAFLLLNFVRLKPGEALFLPAGELHAYLGGRAVEAMANSDNVLRGGLTVKHVDVPELLRLLNFTSARARILRPDRAGRYRTAAKEFKVRVLQFDSRRTEYFVGGHERGAELILNLEGSVRLTWMNNYHLLKPGQGALVPSCVKSYRLKPHSRKALTYVTGVAADLRVP